MCLRLRRIVATGRNQDFISSLLLALFMAKIYSRVFCLEEAKRSKIYLISLQFCFLKVPFQCLLSGLNHDSFPRVVFHHMSFAIGIFFYLLLVCHMSQILAGSFFVLTDTFTAPETQCLEHLMVLMKPAMDFGSKIFLVIAIIGSQCILQ